MVGLTEAQLARAEEIAAAAWPETQDWMLALISEVRRLQAVPPIVDRESPYYCLEHDSTHCNCPDTGPLDAKRQRATRAPAAGEED